MTDRILDAFLARQQLEGTALAAQSDVLSVMPGGGTRPSCDASGYCTSPVAGVTDWAAASLGNVR